MTERNRIIAKGVPFTQIPNDAISDTELTHAQFRVYSYLMRRANTEARAWPSHRTIAKDIGMDKSTVSNAIKALVAAGWVTVHVHQVDDHKQRHSYTVFGTRPERLFLRTDRPTGRIKQPVGETAPTVRIDQPEPSVQSVRKNTQQEDLKNNTQLATPTNGDIIDVHGNRYPSVKAYATALKDALVAAMGWDPKELGPRQWGRVEAAAPELRTVGADPREVDHRAKVYRVNMNGATMTPNAIATNWAALAEVVSPVSSRAIDRAATRQRTRDAVEGLSDDR
jgi:DNA-binding MarR family transcriptional regulator